MEVWKKVRGYDGYEVSDRGRVRSIDRTIQTTKGLRRYKGRILNQTIATNYLSVMLSVKGNQKRFTVHRLVALHFIPNPLNKEQVNHIDGDRLNNSASNLEWVTQSENMKHAHKIGLIKMSEKQLLALEKNRHKGQMSGRVSVNQYALNGELIKTFHSIVEASKATGISVASISENVRGRNKTGGGYVWRYADK